MFFGICNELGRTMRVDARDASGWVPLHLALLLEEEARRVSYMDYYEFARDTEYFLRLSKTFAAHLGDVMARGFFRRWALNYLLELTRHRLPILCCEMIVEKLMNEDLCRVCLAALHS
ncbi:hypothetical protein TKK_0007512 [Trichogramma kaykai]